MFSSVDTMWVLLGALLVFFMQAGFAMVEAGFTRAKNSGNIIMKNVMDLSAGTIVFWLVGFGIMFGASHFGVLGSFDIFVRGDYSSSIPTYAFLIFQTVFCATAATIVSGAMAERTKFSTYLIFSIVLSGLIYPISGHWIWGGGFLSQLGFHDFAGSTAVHMVGGVAALVGAKIVGARIGKYNKDGSSNAIPGHNLTIGALGVFILWFAWFGFNGGSTVSMTGDASILSASLIFVNTNLAAATAAVTTMLITWVKYKKPDVSMTLNGCLAGLVAITAGCDAVSPVGAFFIGLFAAFAIVFGIEFVDKVLKIDDPVGAIGVHGICGALGTILTGVFSVTQGVLYGHGFSFLGVQCLGVVTVAIWVSVTAGLLFMVLKKTMGLRVSAEEELIGLDIEEHGLVSSYADFMPRSTQMDAPAAKPIVVKSEPKDKVPEGDAIPVEVHSNSGDGAYPKISKVTIIANEDKFDLLKDALETIGVTGMTITKVHGCGMQKGRTEYYRGVKLGMHLLPKLKIDLVVCKVPVETVINVAKAVLYTGHIGDGKIFVYDVENVVKVRTGEEHYEALQDD